MKGNELVIPLVTLLLGGGGLAFLQAVFKGAGTLRGGARAREREAVNDLAKARDAADDRAEWAEADRDFWHSDSARQRYQLKINGIEPDPLNPEPPSSRRGRKPSKPSRP